MKITSLGQIALTDIEYNKTQHIWFTQLSCGHYITPRIKGVYFLEKIKCPFCNKEAMVMDDTINSESFTVKEPRPIIGRK